jgi:hypothetical protein
MRVLVLGATGTIASPPPSSFYVTANLKDLRITALGDLTAGFANLAAVGTQVHYPGVGDLPTFPTLWEFNGKDTAVGFNASFICIPHFRNADGKPLVNVGFVYRSALHSICAGSSSGAIALWPVRDQDHEWKLELDLDYTDRQSFGNTDVHRSTEGTPPWSGPSTNGCASLGSRDSRRILL